MRFIVMFALSITTASLSINQADAQGRGRRGGGGAAMSWSSETLEVPGNPKLSVSLSRASSGGGTVLFLFMGCRTDARPQHNFFYDVSRRANRTGIHTVIWNSAEARGQEDHCNGRVSLEARVADAARVRSFLQQNGIGTRFIAIGESQGANVMVRLSGQAGWTSFIALSPHCDRFKPGTPSKMIVFAGDRDDAAPGAACSRWKGAEVHRGADAVHGWQYPDHIGGAVFRRSTDGLSAPKLFNPELSGRLQRRIDQWLSEMRS
jgi:dienelactone hydrolase